MNNPPFSNKAGIQSFSLVRPDDGDERDKFEDDNDDDNDDDDNDKDNDDDDDSL